MKLNNNRPATVLLCVLTALSLNSLAYAQDDSTEDAQPTQVQPHKMSKEERQEMRKKFHKHRKFKREERLHELDTNQDEKVDLNEYLANAEKRFNQLDADGDGYVTREEARSRHHELRQKHKEKRKKMLREYQSEDQQDDGS